VRADHPVFADKQGQLLRLEIEILAEGGDAAEQQERIVAERLDLRRVALAHGIDDRELVAAELREQRLLAVTELPLDIQPQAAAFPLPALDEFHASTLDGDSRFRRKTTHTQHACSSFPALPW
jgi:hypothetical protein